ncbi:MAG: carboxypeptidase M32 [Thermomicrobiales bacterium]|nr:carboxypeptidase M32 [Thermomicrobiales bacterium]
MATAVEQLREHFGTIFDLEAVSALSGWDELVMMRPRGAELRGEVNGTIAKLIHGHWVDPRFGELLELGAEETADLPDDHPDKASIRVARKQRDKRMRIPSELAAAFARETSHAYAVWVEARKNDDFAAFAPSLQKVLDLTGEYIDCFPKAEHPFDTLLQQWDLEFTTAELNAMFAELNAGFEPIIELISSKPDAVSDTVYHGNFPKARQAAMCEEFMLACGAREDVWRLDETVHPFETNMSMDDVRITTRYRDHDLADAFFGTLHETGHGLYEDGVDVSLARLPIGHGGTGDMHESQSRMIENQVGRSRPFFDFALPIFRKHFPDEFNSVTADQLYRGANKMQPSMIRVEADEATYNRHIALRFDIEQKLVTGDLKVNDLPGAWRSGMNELLGVVPETNREGVLQDVHWSAGAVGTFVSYTLGNVIAAQLWQKIVVDLPSIEDQIANGEFGPLREWLRVKVHAHGQTRTTRETLAKIGIPGLDPEPLRASIAKKALELYG